jgi:hypothetical protein
MVDVIRRIAQLGMAGAAVAELIYKFISLGSPEMILLWGGIYHAADFAKEHLPDFLEYLKHKEAVTGSAGYALFRPYAPFMDK